jgi:shikimate dehydrogenase
MESSTVLTFQLGLIGYPLGHSLSPKLHTAALQACNLAGNYSLFPVSMDDPAGLSDLLQRVRADEIAGLNVTIPYKQTVIPFLDELTPTARSIGAVNTIFLRENKLIGDNTDAAGFLADLNASLLKDASIIDNRQSTIGNRKSALVLGAGGSARAVVYALHQAGWNVTVAARRLEQSNELARQFGGIKLQEYNDQTFQHSDAQLIVNTTPVGMSPATNDSPWPLGLPFPKGASVYDLIYNPQETLLVKQARAAGLQAANGLGMLVEQAALAFELWTGRSVPRAIMFEAVHRTNS